MRQGFLYGVYRLENEGCAVHNFFGLPSGWGGVEYADSKEVEFTIQKFCPNGSAPQSTEEFAQNVSEEPEQDKSTERFFGQQDAQR